jgi:hypothetical protein
MNPFRYTKTPKNLCEAQSNVNYWWYEGMECPPDTIEAHWRTFIKEMKREAGRDFCKLRKLLTFEEESTKVKA